MWPQIPGFYPTRQPWLEGICLPLQSLAPVLAGAIIFPLLPGLVLRLSYSKALAGSSLSALASSCTSPGRLPRLRPLYQYINFDMPELMCPSEEKDETLGPAGTATGPELEGELPQGSVCLLGYLESHWVSSLYACSLWQSACVSSNSCKGEAAALLLIPSFGQHSTACCRSQSAHC